jgi:hypothetical protein
MIYFYCLRRNSHTFTSFLPLRWPKPDGARARVVYYENHDKLQVRPGLHVFADIELLEGGEREAAQALHSALKARPQTCVVWNEPLRSARRFEVLSRLEAEGRNRFRARRVVGDTVPEDLRYPIFLRDEHEHLGPLTPVLHTAQEAQKALTKLRAEARPPPAPLLAVEYLDYADSEGVFRKYSAFRLGRALVPRHQFFNHDWVVKQSSPEQHRAEWLAEEQDYLKTNPHRAQLEALFDTFAIAYGRIDYTIVAGQVQVFEINTNPMIVHAPLLEDKRRRRLHLDFADTYMATLVAADPGPGPEPSALLRWWLRPAAARLRKILRRA